MRYIPKNEKNIPKIIFQVMASLSKKNPNKQAIIIILILKTGTPIDKFTPELNILSVKIVLIPTINPARIEKINPSLEKFNFWPLNFENNEYIKVGIIAKKHKMVAPIPLCIFPEESFVKKSNNALKKADNKANNHHDI